MANRTDAHAPSSPEFDPESYEWLGFVDLFPSDDDMMAYSGDTAELAANMKAAGSPKASPQWIYGRCTHCGHAIRYASYLHHTPSNTYITVGSECAGNRFDGLTKAAFQALRKRQALNAKRTAVAIQRAERSAKMEAIDPRLAILMNREETAKIRNSFLTDLSEKAQRWDLSEKQIAAAVRALDRVEAWQAERTTEAATAQPCPSGRLTITGTVVSAKWTHGAYGATYKLVVKDDRGFKVYGTSPESRDCEKGQRITFVATVEPSNDDPTFGFYKRPAKCRVDDLDGEPVPPAPSTEAVA